MNNREQEGYGGSDIDVYPYKIICLLSNGERMQMCAAMIHTRAIIAAHALFGVGIYVKVAVELDYEELYAIETEEA